MQKERLLTPGPTMVPEEVLLELARPMVHHRTPGFRKILAEVVEGLQYVFQTKSDVLVLASSGTGGMEAAVANLLSPGDKALVVRGGKFGERWAEMCETFGISPVCIDVEWGEAVAPERIQEALEEHPDIGAVFTTLCETSTGVATDIKTIGEIVRERPACLVVDAISGIGAMECRMDDWGVDVLVAGSQKALMCPPGLAFVTVSKKAWARIEGRKPAAYYFDLKKARASLTKGDTPFTPAIVLVRGLSKALQLIRAEGIEHVWQRHAVLADAVRTATSALGLELLAKRPANALTAVCAPPGTDPGDIISGMLKLGVRVAGGQEKLKGKILRIAHMGYVDELDIVACISALELTLAKFGLDVESGAGVQAAEEVFARATRQQLE